jgi:hypothetical protein
MRGQGRLHISSGNGTAFTVRGFDAFRAFDIAEVDLPAGRDTIITAHYCGLALIRYANGSVYPLIMEGADTEVRFGNDSPLPIFPEGSENQFLYAFLTTHHELGSRTAYLQNLMSGVADVPDTLDGISEEIGLLKLMLDSLAASLPDPEYPLASFFLRGRMLIESSYGIRTQEELENHKQEFLAYIGNGFTQLRHSDLIQETGRQYMMMNEYVLTGKNTVSETRIGDVAAWVEMLDGLVPAREVIDFFTGVFYERSMVSQASAIVHAFRGDIFPAAFPGFPFQPCDTVPGLLLTNEEAVRTENLADWDVPKVLSFVSAGNMASLSETVMLVRNIGDAGMFLPVVAVPLEGFSVAHTGMHRLCRGFLFYAMDEEWRKQYLHSGMQLPCFLLLDGSNVVTFVSADRQEIMLEAGD